jgi:purine-nucleoside phosphorylase
VTAGAAPVGLPGPSDSFAQEGAALIRERSSVAPFAAVVLGSGLGDAVGDDVEVEHEFAFEALPGFSPPSVPGHAGRLLMGRLYGVPAAVFRGRIHFYEGLGIGATTLIPRLAAALGARVLVLTNSAGGLARGGRVGRLMLIEDHINLLGVNPLLGWRHPDGTPAFVDVSRVYDRALLGSAERVAAGHGLDIARGVYVALPGPSYETPAETAMLAHLGADAVGMSTVPEAVAATALGLRVLGMACITNLAGGDAAHEEVLRTAAAAAPALRTILAGVLGELAPGSPSGHDEPDTSTGTP